MRKLFTLLMVLFALAASAQMAGTWKMSPEAGALGVGPAMGDISWWSNTTGDVTTRACYFDDEYVLGEDGTFQNVQQDETWIEEWQGMNPPACGTPVYPHDGANAATWTWDEAAGTLTLNGVGAYMGLAKVFNLGELTAPGDAPESITYLADLNATSDTLTLNIDIGGGFWRFILTTNGGTPPPPADPLALPVTFDDADIDYALLDFDGTTSSIIDDPVTAGNKVVQTVRSETAQFWAGTIAGDPSGLVTPMPFTEGNTTMSVRVYSPEAGIPVLFKLEDSSNSGVSVEVLRETTVANTWETLYFDMTDVVEGTAAFDFANTYNKPVIFFDFGIPGADAGELTFMWDDIAFVDASSIQQHGDQSLSVYPNPASDRITLGNANLSDINVFAVSGQLMLSTGNTTVIDVSNYPAGLYTIVATDNQGQRYNTRFMVK